MIQYIHMRQMQYMNFSSRIVIQSLKVLVEVELSCGHVIRLVLSNFCLSKFHDAIAIFTSLSVSSSTPEGVGESPEENVYRKFCRVLNFNIQTV